MKRATSQFSGHYQPHIPGELGYYDLRMPEVQRRQVELAKIVRYWWVLFLFLLVCRQNAARIADSTVFKRWRLDLPFCLCWANENWSRRWDELIMKSLLRRDHSPQDDLAFIEHVSRYLRDPRYIRIQGKPLLIVYRPGLMPSAKKPQSSGATGAGTIIWRNLSRLYSIIRSITSKKYGFDGAVEFPPNNSAPPVITDQVVPQDCNFSGIVTN